MAGVHGPVDPDSIRSTASRGRTSRPASFQRACARISVATRLTITADAMACARFATISPNEAAQRAVHDWGIDMLEFRTTVSPAAVNESGWMFDVECTAAPSFGESRGFRIPWVADGQLHFLWSIGASEEWGLLGLHAEVDWDTGECLDGCSR